MNSLRPKAAFFDIDGTLVPYDTRCISQADREAVEALRGQGTLVFIVTGRHICDVDNIPFPVDGAVCCNGAMTYAVMDGCACFHERDRFELIEHHPIPRAQALDIARIIASRQIPSAVVSATRTFSCHLSRQALAFVRRANMPDLKEGDILEAAENECIYTFCPFVSPEEESLLFGEQVRGLDTSRWCREYCDISVRGFDKAGGMKRILDLYQIDTSDIIAFGDGSNDIGMLEFAGCGIAMGNAADEVKSAADQVTASVNDNGVSKWLSALETRANSRG